MNVSPGVISPVSPSKARKRPIRKENWKASVAKRLRYAPNPTCSTATTTCSHNTKQKQCKTLTPSDIEGLHDQYHLESTKQGQDLFLYNCLDVAVTKRKRLQPGKPRRQDNMCFTKYVLPVNDRKVLVCRKTFLEIFHAKPSRVRNLSNKKLLNRLPKEGRGGDHKKEKFKEKKQAVIDFICSLKHILENHYCRGKTNRQYLPSEFNIESLSKMYNNKVKQELKVKSSYFRYIFNRNFNIGFGTPRVDVCSTCLELKEKKKLLKDESEKVKVVVELEIHKKRAKAFFQLLKVPEPNELVLSFDCQKNLPCPKVPDQEAYYRRQLYLYNFTVVVGSSKAQLTHDNVFSYVWTENKFKKGSNEIASCVYHRLNNTDLNGFERVKLFADGCGGQNKNQMLLIMAATWLVRNAPSHIKSVELVFPIRGHSFIPPDRVFGAVEKEFRKKEVIETPDDYIDLIRKHPTVIEVNDEIYDWKTEADQLFKPLNAWHFKFAPSKRYVNKRSEKNKRNILTRGEEFYYTDLCPSRSIFKAGKNAMDSNPSQIKPFQPGLLKPAKIKDVKRLLQLHFSDEWQKNEKLSFYKKLFGSGDPADDPDELEEDEPVPGDLCEDFYEESNEPTV